MKKHSSNRKRLFSPPHNTTAQRPGTAVSAAASPVDAIVIATSRGAPPTPVPQELTPSIHHPESEQLLPTSHADHSIPHLAYPQPSSQSLSIYKADGSPAAPETKWEDLHADSQALLLRIEERIAEYRTESASIDQHIRICNPCVPGNRPEIGMNCIRQELERINILITRENVSSKENLHLARKMTREVDSVVVSCRLIQQSRLQADTGASSVASLAPLSTSQVITNQAVLLRPPDDLPRKPSPYMKQMVARFEKNLAIYAKQIEELEELLHLDGSSSIQSVQDALSNIHCFLIAVAAKVENLHQKVQDIKVKSHAKGRQS